VPSAACLAAAFGRRLPPDPGRPAELDRLFPEPRALATAEIERCGVTGARGDAIRALAVAILDRSVDLDGAGDPAAAERALVALPGIGQWTVQYVALRALGEPDAFPAGDLGLRRALATEPSQLPSARDVERMAESWRPWRAYAAVALWTAEASR
jgi:AraC family transcriptional regulator of adaptative response / DNA-3-methyladenine glycosylase II